MFDIKEYETYIEVDEPLPYKNLLIYPVKTKDYRRFFDAVTCLTIDKDIISPEMAAMSYLDFFGILITSESFGEKIQKQFEDIAKLCLGLEKNEFYFGVDNDGIIVLVTTFGTFKRRDFDSIRKIILYQNIPGYDDVYVDPELAKAIEEENEMRARKAGSKNITFEDRLSALAILTSFNFDTIYNLPIRRFFFILNKSIAHMEYKISRTAELSGNVKFDRPISDWVPSNSGKNIVEEHLGQYGELKKKIGTT